MTCSICHDSCHEVELAFYLAVFLPAALAALYPIYTVNSSEFMPQIKRWDRRWQEVTCGRIKICLGEVKAAYNGSGRQAVLREATCLEPQGPLLRRVASKHGTRKSVERPPRLASAGAPRNGASIRLIPNSPPFPLRRRRFVFP